MRFNLPGDSHQCCFCFVLDDSNHMVLLLVEVIEVVAWDSISKSDHNLRFGQDSRLCKFVRSLSISLKSDRDPLNCVNNFPGCEHEVLGYVYISCWFKGNPLILLYHGLCVLDSYWHGFGSASVTFQWIVIYWKQVVVNQFSVFTLKRFSVICFNN